MIKGEQLLNSVTNKNGDDAPEQVTWRTKIFATVITLNFFTVLLWMLFLVNWTVPRGREYFIAYITPESEL